MPARRWLDVPPADVPAAARRLRAAAAVLTHLLSGLGGLVAVGSWASRIWLDAAKYTMSVLESAGELLLALWFLGLALILRILLLAAWLAHIFGAAFGAFWGTRG